MKADWLEVIAQVFFKTKGHGSILRRARRWQRIAVNLFCLGKNQNILSAGCHAINYLITG